VEEIEGILDSGRVPVLVDPEANVLQERPFEILVDARLAKKNLGVRMTDARVVIGIGPGFNAGQDCHAVVETLQGGGMGRVIRKGSAAADTGEPCALNLPGACPDPALPPESRVLRAPRDGVLKALRSIGDPVEAGDRVAEVAGEAVTATLRGFLRGLVRDGLVVHKGLKIGEVDLSGKVGRGSRISEKANAVAGGVLEACHVLLVAR
jgi:xanthine dehydrogenase accessory factor